MIARALGIESLLPELFGPFGKPVVSGPVTG
jgi:hypothetical protein